MRLTRPLLAILLGLSLVPVTAAAKGAKSFTATAVQTAPNTQSQSGKIFVSDTGTRFEFSEYGRDVVQITLTDKKLMRVLFPADKFYIETTTPKETPITAAKSTTPCPSTPAMVCRKLGNEKFGTMDVERWSQSITGLKGEATLWWDPKRKMIVRQEYPDGRVMQMQLSNKDAYNGRDTERWDISYVQQGRTMARAVRLIDVELGIIVKEQSPSGMIRELRDLKAVNASPEWFTVPDGYQKIEPPKPETLQKQ
ncbi:MAG: hypothetical protein HOK06_02450 [Rhodospirillaceae bacterium]|jgi:hypothetical protein|nr:hypothetical protein [Rhodospirillaceae bacterium]MBT4219451.1 hypothetical protein [Rhodospirillaceae bacterium]MBT5014310.1 hypothetical protein [Rhodospirillaceae bacterium]MBT5308812.1 hypothetical protein [Rhodospirillaceae bacterium]MBT6406438.1 hypothetical protein [Rhodospirillaceae bacterium]